MNETPALEARGRALADAVEARPELSAAELCRMARLSRQTYYLAVAGKASEKALSAFEEALTEWDEHPEDRPVGPPSPDFATEGIIEVQLDGFYGAERVIVRGPVENPEAIQSTVEGVLARIRRVTE